MPQIQMDSRRKITKFGDRVIRALLYNCKFARLGQIFRKSKTLDSDIPLAKDAKFGSDVISTARLCENLSEPFDRAQGERISIEVCYMCVPFVLSYSKHERSFHTVSRRAKSFRDPSHWLGMTGISPPPLRLRRR